MAATRKIRIVLLALGLAVVCALVPGQAGAGSNVAATTLRADVFTDLNAIRVQYGLVPLTLDRELGAAAADHSDEMFVNGYFGHESANGSAYWKRIESFYPVLPGASWSVGENLLWADGSMDAQHAVLIWMQSPQHRANILTPRWRQVGISAIVDSAAPGVFGGSPVTLLTADFGAR